MLASIGRSLVLMLLILNMSVGNLIRMPMQQLDRNAQHNQLFLFIKIGRNKDLLIKLASSLKEGNFKI